MRQPGELFFGCHVRIEKTLAHLGAGGRHRQCHERQRADERNERVFSDHSTLTPQIKNGLRVQGRMPICVNQPEKTQLHHDARREDRRRFRPHHLREDVPAALCRVDLQLELRSSAKMKPHAGGPREEKQHHRGLERANARRVAGWRRARRSRAARSRSWPGARTATDPRSVRSATARACASHAQHEHGEEPPAHHRQRAHPIPL